MLSEVLSLQSVMKRVHDMMSTFTSFMHLVHLRDTRLSVRICAYSLQDDLTEAWQVGQEITGLPCSMLSVVNW
jgi:hypothetical protein